VKIATEFLDNGTLLILGFPLLASCPNGDNSEATEAMSKVAFTSWLVGFMAMKYPGWPDLILK